MCTLFACTCHFTSSSGLGRCLSGYLLFCCSSYPLRQLSSKTEMAVRRHQSLSFHHLVDAHHGNSSSLTVRSPNLLPRVLLSRRCQNTTDHRIAQGWFYFRPCLSTDMNDAPACRRVDRCYHASRGPRGSEARPPAPPITSITQNQEDRLTAASAKRAPKKLVPREFPR